MDLNRWLLRKADLTWMWNLWVQCCISPGIRHIYVLGEAIPWQNKYLTNTNGSGQWNRKCECFYNKGNATARGHTLIRDGGCPNKDTLGKNLRYWAPLICMQIANSFETWHMSGIILGIGVTVLNATSK